MNTKLTLAAMLLTAGLAAPALASLGGQISVTRSTSSTYSQSVAKAVEATSSGTSPSTTAFSIHEVTLPSGTLVREYTDANGIVFAVSWNGPDMPDLRDLFGEHFDNYVASVQNARAQRGAGHGAIAINQSGLVVQSGGHMRALIGRAWLPALLPKGVTSESIE